MKALLAYLHRRKVQRLKQRIAGLDARIEFYQTCIPEGHLLTDDGWQTLGLLLQERAQLQERLNQLRG